MYNTKVIQWGHSQALSLPKDLKERLNLEIGQKLNVYVTDSDEIIISKSDNPKLNPKVEVVDKI